MRALQSVGLCLGDRRCLDGVREPGPSLPLFAATRWISRLDLAGFGWFFLVFACFSLLSTSFDGSMAIVSYGFEMFSGFRYRILVPSQASWRCGWMTHPFRTTSESSKARSSRFIGPQMQDSEPLPLPNMNLNVAKTVASSIKSPFPRSISASKWP